MRVSLNIIKRYIDFELPPVVDLVKRINEQLGGVEEVIDLGVKYKDPIIVKVVECEKHPNADKLFSCKIDAGTGELIQVVCGAPNVHAGMWAVWLPPESIVPSTYGSEDEFKLAARDLRGIVSNGMLASARELGIGEDHNGIVEIDENEWKPSEVAITPGQSFAVAYGLDDTIIDIENKMFTHRPDLFGQLGVAREISGILGHKFVSPEWYMTRPEFGQGNGLELEVFNGSTENVPRFMAVAVRDVTIKPSPLWLQIELMRLGSKAINNIVDTTNYVMLLTAQPTHAYDYDKLRGNRLGARLAKPGEKITLLNGKTYDLSESDIVIADGEGAVGLAGIMGGAESEISSDTKNIVLEVATFDMYAVRKTSMRHGIFTDAVTRFNKGQSPLQNDRVLNLLMMSVNDVAGGAQASEAFDSDDVHMGIAPRDSLFGSDTVTAKFINARLGLMLESRDMMGLLQNVEIICDGIDADGISYEAPFWRTDIEQPEDIVEEIGRLHGYDKLLRVLPTRNIKPVAKNPNRVLKHEVREILSRAGANEVMTYSFVHERILKNAEQDIQNAYRLSNALSPDLQYYRESLTPSLLAQVHSNSKSGYDEFALFELNKTHDRQSGMNEEDVPVEHESVALVYASKSPHEGAPYYQAKAMLEFLADELNIRLAYEPLNDQSTSPLAAPFESLRAAIVTDVTTGTFIGILGEYTKAVRRNFKLPDYTAGFEIDTEALLKAREKTAKTYMPLSRYPGTERDISFCVAPEVIYGDIISAVSDSLKDTDLKIRVAPLTIYRAENGDSKTITIRIGMTPFDRTLTTEAATDIMNQVATTVCRATGARVA